jgi:hypothetical protein
MTSVPSTSTKSVAEKVSLCDTDKRPSGPLNYKKLTQREHILQLPDTYIGSRDSHRESRWVYDSEAERMEWREITFNPGLFKIFDELIVNALDHVTRQATATSRVATSAGASVSAADKAKKRILSKASEALEMSSLRKTSLFLYSVTN